MKKTRILYLCSTHMMTSNDFLYLFFLFGFKFLLMVFKEWNTLHETFFAVVLQLLGAHFYTAIVFS